MPPPNIMPVQASINTNKNKQKIGGFFQYPSNLGSHAMMFTFMKYNRNKSFAERKILDQVILPIPQELNEIYGASYQDMQLGTFGGEMGQLAEATKESISKIGKSDNMLKTATEQAKKLGTTAADLSASGALGLMARRFLSGISSELGAVVDLSSGNVPNPHAALLFNGVNLRSHSFNWRLSPTSSGDEKKLHTIFNIFKTHMLPTTKGITTSGKGDVLMTYPDEVDITFHGSDSKLYKMKRCVVADMTINQAPEGPAFHAGTGNPVFYGLSLNLREVEILTREDFDEPAEAVDYGAT